MNNELLIIILLSLVSYLLGSIPFSYLIGKIFYNTDIRQRGSKNVGATNVFRVIGKKAGTAAMLMDAGKGYLSVFIANKVFGGNEAGSLVDTSYVLVIIGIFAIIGHNWPVFLKFKGGKGVATSLGVAIALAPVEIAIAATVFTVLLFSTRYVSVGSITASIVFLIALILFKEPAPLLVFGVLASCFIIIRHIPNIKRLLKGTENKVWQKK